jgi:hypothetical protein
MASELFDGVRDARSEVRNLAQKRSDRDVLSGRSDAYLDVAARCADRRRPFLTHAKCAAAVVVVQHVAHSAREGLGLAAYPNSPPRKPP